MRHRLTQETPLSRKNFMMSLDNAASEFLTKYHYMLKGMWNILSEYK